MSTLHKHPIRNSRSPPSPAQHCSNSSSSFTLVSYSASLSCFNRNLLHALLPPTDAFSTASQSQPNIRDTDILQLLILAPSTTSPGGLKVSVSQCCRNIRMIPSMIVPFLECTSSRKILNLHRSLQSSAGRSQPTSKHTSPLPNILKTIPSNEQYRNSNHENTADASRTHNRLPLSSTSSRTRMRMDGSRTRRSQRTIPEFKP